MFERIKAGQLPSFDYEPWPDISEEAKACVRRMLKHSPSDRATADEILTDPWMQRNGVASDKPLGVRVVGMRGGGWRARWVKGVDSIPETVSRLQGVVPLRI